MSPTEVTSWLEAVPKAELHLHLEGSIPLTAMWELVVRSGGDPAVPTAEALTERYRFTDFPHFIETWLWKTRFIRTADDFELIGSSVAESLAAQNIVYVEAFFSPSDFAHSGLGGDEITMALRRGLDTVPEVDVSLIVDLVRGRPTKAMLRTLDQLDDVAAAGRVIGVGLGGEEHAFPPEEVESVWKEAAARGYRLTAHAGEAAGPASVRSALRSLGVERIGHGFRVVEDPALLAEVVERQIPLEVCPTSNVATGVVRSLAEHPVGQLIEAGAVVTLNTDDPAMFGNRLADEYRLVAETFQLDRSVVERLVRAGVAASWADDSTKAALLGRIDHALAE